MRTAKNMNMTNKELRTALEKVGVKTNAKMKKAELEQMYDKAFGVEVEQINGFRVIDVTEKHTATSEYFDKYEQLTEQTEQTEQTETEQTAEQPKVVFKKVNASVRNFEQLLDTLTAYNLAVSYTNRRIVTDAMLFCKRAHNIARVYVKNSYETLIDDMLTEYDGYKGYYDIKDNDDLDIVIVALQSATRVERKRVTKAVADRIK